MRSHVFNILYLLILFISTTNAKSLPVEAFASLPDVSSVALSPDGRKVISLVKIETGQHSGKLINLYNVETKKSKPLVFSDNQKYVVTQVYWASNDYALVEAKFPASRYGTPVTETRLLKIDINSGKISSLLPKHFMKQLKYVPNIMSNVIDIMPHDENHILMSMAGFGSDASESVIRVSLSGRGRTRVIQKHRSDVMNWLTDYQSNVRIAVEQKGSLYTIFEYQAKERKYRELWQFEAFSEDAVWPLKFDSNPNILYVEAHYNGKDAIYKVDLSQPELKKELVYFDEEYDVVGNLRRSPKTGEIIGIGSHFWHPDYQKLQKGIDQALPDTYNHMFSLSDDESRYLVLSTDDTDPGMYLIGDRKAKTVNYIAARYPNLTQDALADKVAISYKARDGLKIEGFLTTPKGKSDKNLPTIIFPHGGPISYDGDGFDYWTQFLANRGYAVLQMNFRGSSGYGHDFMKQGLQSWGQSMQDDVEDGTRWLIEQGVADKDNICIVGASYGGYAALMGAVKTPDLYQCIISFAGVTDVEYLVKSQRRFTNYDIVKKQIGDDYDRLWQISPLKHVDKITKPVLLIHGSKDRVVRVRHSDKMASKLKRADKAVRYLEIDGADHYLSNNEHRLQTFTEIESFLAKHLKSDSIKKP